MIKVSIEVNTERLQLTLSYSVPTKTDGETLAKLGEIANNLAKVGQTS